MQSTNPQAASAARATRRAANSKYAQALARLGLSARGVVYIVMGLLTLSVANGNPPRGEIRAARSVRFCINHSERCSWCCWR